MGLNIAFWILMGVWGLFRIALRTNEAVTKYHVDDLLLFLAMVCLGWGVFHAPIKG